MWVPYGSNMADPTPRWISRAAIGMGSFVTLAGIAHFTNPKFFDDIVPPWLPPSERFWTHASGVAELIIGPSLLWRPSRRKAALAAIALFVAVYPANLYMAWDWRDRPWREQIVAYVRLPFQFVFVWLAWRIHRAEASNRT